MAGQTKSMPDIAESRLEKALSPLDQVGMENIESPILVDLDGNGQNVSTLARADTFVNISDPHSKGIHMSRLFLHLQNFFASRTVNFANMQQLLDQFVESHSRISDSAYLNLRFDLPIKRKALLSDNHGWRAYPTKMESSLKQGVRRSKLEVGITYSSTCPCSAALARQLIQAHFEKEFAPDAKLDRQTVYEWLGKATSLAATPHGQRSLATVTLYPRDASATIAFVDLIDRLERSLKTPVQTAVKREDEQEFARLNGQNLMFAEDASRQLKETLDSLDWLAGYGIETRHFESLHAHDAVAKVYKIPEY